MPLLVLCFPLSWTDSSWSGELILTSKSFCGWPAAPYLPWDMGYVVGKLSCPIKVPRGWAAAYGPAAAVIWVALPGLCSTQSCPTGWHGTSYPRFHLCSCLQGPALCAPCAQGLFALNDSSILRAFNFPVVQGPAVTKRKVGAIRLCCLSGFQGDCGLLGLNSSFSSLAPWCDVLKALRELSSLISHPSTTWFLSKPPVIFKRKPRFVCIDWRSYIYLCQTDGLVRRVMKITRGSACCCSTPYGIQAPFITAFITLWYSCPSIRGLPLDFELCMGLGSILLIPVSPVPCTGAGTQ